MIEKQLVFLSLHRKPDRLERPKAFEFETSRTESSQTTGLTFLIKLSSEGMLYCWRIKQLGNHRFWSLPVIPNCPKVSANAYIIDMSRIKLMFLHDYILVFFPQDVNQWLFQARGTLIWKTMSFVLYVGIRLLKAGNGQKCSWCCYFEIKLTFLFNYSPDFFHLGLSWQFFRVKVFAIKKAWSFFGFCFVLVRICQRKFDSDISHFSNPFIFKTTRLIPIEFSIESSLYSWSIR